MCMLTYLPPATLADATALTNGAQANPDGHGYAIVTENELIVERSMDAAGLITEFQHVRAAFPDGPALFHSRLATHGHRGTDNCHPFPLGGDRRTVLAHNGILPAEVHPGKRDPRSDTRIAAEDFLPTRPFGPIDSVAGRHRLETWLGPYNKMVILTVDPRYRSHAYLLNETAGHWIDRTWYSNRDYLGFRADWPELICPDCGEVDTDGDGYCLSCGWCFQCGAPYRRCICDMVGARFADGDRLDELAEYHERLAAIERALDQ